ncbi:DUF5345 family protein [Paenibacillus sp. CAU 1782]
MNNGRKTEKTEKHKKIDDDAMWFQENMLGKLQQFDDAHAPEPPAMSMLETLVVEHKRNLQKAKWAELLLFWLVAVCILLGMVWMAEANAGLFWGMYGTVSAVCLLFFCYKFVGRAKV